MESVENFLKIVLLSTQLSTVFNVLLIIFFTMGFVTRTFSTVLLKEALSVISVIICISYQMIKNHVFQNNQSVIANNMTQHLISVLFVKMDFKSHLTENV